MAEVKYRPGWWNEFLTYVSRGATDKEAAAVLDLHLQKIRKFVESNPGLEQEWKEARKIP
jgi:hypothetical protein